MDAAGTKGVAVAEADRNQQMTQMFVTCVVSMALVKREPLSQKSRGQDIISAIKLREGDGLVNPGYGQHKHNTTLGYAINMD